MWVSTNWTGVRIEDADNIGFNRLFEYISGANEQGAKIDMTTPVRTLVKPGQGPNCESFFQVSFYVPYAYQYPNPPPPSPTSDLVYFTKLPQMTFATLGFPGFAFTWDEILPHFIELGSYLDRNGYDWVGAFETVAGYDPPFRLRNRWNEVNLLLRN